MDQPRSAPTDVGPLRRDRTGLQQLVGWRARTPRAHGRTGGVAVAACRARALIGATLGSQGGTFACSGHHSRCCSARTSEIFIYVSPEEVYSK